MGSLHVGAADLKRAPDAFQASAHGPGEASTSGSELRERLEEGVRIAGLLARNTEEMTGVLRALNGEYILPEAGGDLLRDGAGVLPTGGVPVPFITLMFPS